MSSREAGSSKCNGTASLRRLFAPERDIDRQRREAAQDESASPPQCGAGNAKREVVRRVQQLSDGDPSRPPPESKPAWQSARRTAAVAIQNESSSAHNEDVDGVTT